MLPESRLASLYSDFRKLQELNPDGFQANVLTWKDHLMNTVWRDELLIEGGDELLERLSTKEMGFPKSIDVAIDQLVMDRRLVPLGRFVRGPDFGLLSWVRWTLHKVVDLSWRSRARESGRYLRNCAYVNMDVLAARQSAVEVALEERVVARATRYTDLVFSREEFYGVVREALRGRDEYDVVLADLDKHRKAILVDGDVVKVVMPAVRALVQPFGPDRVTANDRHIAEFKGSLRLAERQVQAIHGHVEETARALRGAVAAGAARDVQRRYLRMNKLAQASLSRALSQFTNLMEIKDHIDKSVDNLHLVEVLSGASRALADINRQIGSLDDVERLLDDVHEHMEDGERISGALTASVAEDDGELDSELAAMERDLQQEQQQEEKLLGVLERLQVSDKTPPAPARAASPVKEAEQPQKL
ncbi:AaceriAEL183Cp [[Ashbya] aceris (nom. inval.)]|nr:AaceriAEL183Cp [[Ashbya] aceris (nom. inval.)]